MGCWKGNRRGEGNGIGGGRGGGEEGKGGGKGRGREGEGGEGRGGEEVRTNCLYSSQTIILSGYGTTCDCMRLQDGLYVILT